MKALTESLPASARSAWGVAEPRSPLPIQAGLEPYTRPLDRRQLAHLLRRAAFAAHPDALEEYEGQTASQVVGTLLATATNTAILPLPPKPSWADIPMPDRQTDSSEEVKQYNLDNRDWLAEYRMGWFGGLAGGALREKMTLFWSNHFVTGAETYELASMAYRYIALLRQHAFGNFKEFVRAIGKTPAMLVYLNGDTNVKDSPNENYARELLELFTMGPLDRVGNPNYAQTDIQQIARAQTGWTIDYKKFTPQFDASEFDDGTKSFFGRTGAFGYDDVVDILFAQRPDQIAYFVCAAIYREFVYDVPDEDVVLEMASLFRANNFAIQPVVSALLQSAHFFDAQAIGAKVKSPVELVVGLMLETSFDAPEDTIALLTDSCAELGQYVLDPPDVSGWPGHRAWLSTNTLPLRWSTTDTILFAGRSMQPIDVKALAARFPEASDPLAAFRLPVALAQHLLAVPLVDLQLEDIDDPFDGDLVDHPIPGEILSGPAYVRTLAKWFLNGVPWYEWALQESGSNALLLNYFQVITQMPEYNLT